MRFLIVTDFALTYVGGAQIALMRQAEALFAAGHEVYVVAQGSDKKEWSPGIQLTTPPQVRNFPGIEMPMFRRTPELEAFVMNLFEYFKPDALLTHSEFALTATAMAEARRRGVLTINTVHTFYWHAPGVLGPLAPLARVVYRQLTKRQATKVKLSRNALDSAMRNMTLAACLESDLTISPSHHQAEKLRAAGVQNLAIVSNVTETAGKPTELPSGDVLKLAWIGRFSPEKRLEVATKAVDLANSELGNKIEFHIAGGPKVEGNNHIWHGTLTPGKVSELLRQSHALIMTSLGFDNQPMVILEAFSHGRPVVLTDPVLAGEFGEAAFLSATPDAKGLAAELVRIYRNREELEARSRFATEATKVSTAAKHAQKIADLVLQFSKKLSSTTLAKN